MIRSLTVTVTALVFMACGESSAPRDSGEARADLMTSTEVRFRAQPEADRWQAGVVGTVLECPVVFVMRGVRPVAYRVTFDSLVELRTVASADTSTRPIDLTALHRDLGDCW